VEMGEARGSGRQKSPDGSIEAEAM